MVMPIPVYALTINAWRTTPPSLSVAATNYIRTVGFAGEAGAVRLVPNETGRIEAVLLGLGEDAYLHSDPFLAGKLIQDLPDGEYTLKGTFTRPDLVYLSLALARYRFDRYKPAGQRSVAIAIEAPVDTGRMDAIAEAVIMGRDLINSPTSDLGTNALAAAALALADTFGAIARETLGDDLKAQNFPLIHAVGRAASEPPRLIDFTWVPAYMAGYEAVIETLPKVTLVGKGVVYDTGGLNIKPGNSMELMRKDMAGSAVALSAARMIMAQELPIRLRVLLPIVENAVAGNAFRAGDIYPSRKGLSVEIGNTDAEGRLVLADALALADEETPDLLLDFATLTGAARVALGPDIPAFYTHSDHLAEEITRFGMSESDPAWRLPLWQAYGQMIDSKVAHLNNSGTGGSFAGSITAALFLSRFVTHAKEYAHFDLYGWNYKTRPGRPEGGEPQVARLVAALVKSRYGRD